MEVEKEDEEEEQVQGEPHEKAEEEADAPPKLEWTTTLSRLHVMGSNPYLVYISLSFTDSLCPRTSTLFVILKCNTSTHTLPKKLRPERLFSVGDPIYILGSLDKLFISKISIFHSYCHTGYRLCIAWKDFIKERDLAIRDVCQFKIRFNIIPNDTPVVQLTWLNLGMNP